MPKRKPLQPEEVPLPWRKYIQWEAERKSNKSKTYLIQVACPICEGVRWVKEAVIRARRCKTLRCQICKKRKPLVIDEVPERWKPLILWDKKREKNTQDKWAVWVKCPVCRKQRLVEEMSLRAGEVGSGLCRLCAVKRKGRRGKKSNIRSLERIEYA